MKDTFIINKDISWVINQYLPFKDRYRLSLCSHSFFMEFCKFKHPEILTIWDRDLYKLARRMGKWKNTRFSICLLKCLNMTSKSILNSEVKDINMLECDKIDDISMLKKAFYLDLSFFRKIKDVSMLGNINTLILRRCYNITDVSALKNIKTLDLSQCYKIIDVSMLLNVRVLILRGCYRITDISTFRYGKMKILDISGCYGIRKIPNLSNLEIYIRRNY
jgi:hypothetical protein